MALDMITESVVRKRRKDDSELRTSNQFQSERTESQTQIKTLFAGHKVWTTVVIFHFALYLFLLFRITSIYPIPKTFSASSASEFFEGNAVSHLHKLTDLGPRPSGSYANEVEAYKYILEQIQEIKLMSQPQYEVEIDSQTVSGSFSLEFLQGGNMTHVYRNLKNIVVKLGTKKAGSSSSVLINCHYDSVVDSPGASDNGVSCAVMLELLRGLTQGQEFLTHSIIFLFNSAEENVLQASHGFITQHPWAKSVKAFINLDSTGAGGWEVVFQTGPEHPWLIQAYARSAPYPFGSAFAQEVFQSGIVPGDTDFRIFRDYGNIPGIDIAYITNGYVYHTKNDLPKFIPPGCIQRGGENLISLLRSLSNSTKLSDPKHHKYGQMIYFDIAGIYMLCYTKTVGMIVNCLIIVSVIISVGRKCFGQNMYGVPGKTFSSLLLQAIVCLLLTWIIALAVCIIIAFCVHMVGYPLSWFTNTSNILWLYVVPSIIVSICFHLVLKSFYKAYNPWLIELIYFDASLVLWTIILTALTYVGLASAFIPLLWVMCPLIIRDRSQKLFKMDFKDSLSKYMLIHLGSVALPCLISLTYILNVFTLFIPIAGRMGSTIIADIPISLVAAVAVAMCFSYQVGLVYVCEDMKKVVYALLAISAVGILCIILTPLGFPFSGNPDRPTPRRVFVNHIDFKHYDRNKALIKEENFLVAVPFDIYGAESTLYSPKHMAKLHHHTCEQQGPYCGFPYLLPLISMFDPTKFTKVPSPPLQFNYEVSVKLLKKEPLAENVQRWTFSVMSSCDVVNWYIDLHPEVEMIRWSLGDGHPQTTKMPSYYSKKTNYFIKYNDAANLGKPEEVFFDLKFKQFHGEDTAISIAVGNVWAHGENKDTKEMKDIMNSLPDWVTPISWASTYHAFDF